MSKFFRTLLQAREPMFSTTLRQLEARTGKKSVDIAYQADITSRAHQAMRKLGLDPADTTKQELYRALNANADNAHLFSRLDDVAIVYPDGDVVSLSQEDVLANRDLAFSKRSTRYMKCHVQHELLERYIAAKKSDKAAIEALYLEAGINACELLEYHKKKLTHSKDATPYILCVGDIFSDVFIKLLESEARIDTDPDGSKRLSMTFGNKPPYERADTVYSVGPSPNAAVSMSRLGAQVGLMSWLGGDQVGKDSLEYLAKEKIDATPMVIQKKMLSNTYYVLRYGADRTILVKNEDYTYTWKKPQTKPDWIYLSLLSEDSWQLHEDLMEYLEQNPEIKFAFQPGTFHFKWGAKKLSRLYKRAEIVVMNREEAVDVTGKSYDSLQELSDGLHHLGAKYVVITDGPNGSYASYDGKLVTIPNYPDPAPPLDRTGAGDAFASTIVTALALGEDMDTALTWAPINSMSVVQQLGAQAGLLTQRKLKKYLSDAPDWYVVKEHK